MIKFLKLCMALLVCHTTTLAQEWTGTFNSAQGTLNLVTENTLVYGDIGKYATIVGVEKKFNGGTRLCGIFSMGGKRGKCCFQKFNDRNNITGFFNYDDDITLKEIIDDPIFNMRFDFDAQWKWDLNKVNSTKPTALKTALFNGKFNSNYGVLQLQQVGNKVTGTYKNVESINAVYNSTTQKLNGTFTNNGNTGYFELDAKLAGNAFSGKWGWNESMDQPDSWTWSKVEKVNSIITNNAVATTNNTTALNNNQSSTTKYRFAISQASSGEIPAFREPQLYGFASIKLFRVTQNERVEIKSFGNKSVYFFNTTENNPSNNLIIDFPENNVTYYRDYVINTADLNNDDVDIEVEISHHLKGKVIGENLNFGYYKEVLNIENITLDTRPNFKGNFIVGKNYANGVYQENSGKHSDVIINLKKL